MDTCQDLPTVDLVQRTQAGDLAAREALFARYRERVLAIARVRLSARLRQRLESGDILQEALIEAVQGLGRFEMRDESSLIRWLAVLVERRITAKARYHGAEKRAGAELSIEHAGDLSLAAHDPPPAEDLDTRESQKRVQEALSALPERQRELVLLRDYAGSSWESIASELGLASPDAARMMHARALVKLGGLLRAGKDPRRELKTVIQPATRAAPSDPQ